jgi:cytochrome c
MRKLVVVVAAMVTVAGFSAAAAQDPSAGVGPTAKNKVGPILNGLDGRKSGTAAGYNYSDAKGSGITWNEESFLDYIRDPKAKVPNTKMAFAGIKNEAEAKALWACLNQYDAEGKTK